jgi:hypothetical protein
MLSPARVSQLTVEFVFVLLGGLVIWLGLRQQINFNRHSMVWLAVSVGVIAWGALALARPGQWWMHWQKWNRAGSLLLLGLLMLAIGRVPFALVGKLLALCGVVLILRGLLGAFLILKQR